MPRENKKRGRRAEAQKRKREEAEEAEAEDYDHDLPDHQKRRRTFQDEASLHPDAPDDENEHGDPQDACVGPPADGRPASSTAFYGLLDEQEQDYFKSADEMLELNQFANRDERSLFLANVYKEASGKELKMTCSQSCSRLLERLIQLSTPEQLKKLFQQFNGHFLNLVQHRFASHCCEALFTQSAPTVTQELIHPAGTDDLNGSNGEPVVTMENLFLFTINELDGDLGFLMTHRYASHTLRVLLMILAGQPVDANSRRHLLRSKRKEGIDRPPSENWDETRNEKRPTPSSFTTALEKLVHGTLLGLDSNHLRTLATHETANPVLQILLQCELTTFGKQRAKQDSSLMKRLLPDEPLIAGTESAAFLGGLLHDPVGSRLYQSIVKYAPGKTFKAIYKEFFRRHSAAIAKHDIASYVAATVLERLSAEDLRTELESITPQIPDLVQRNRIHFIRTLIDRCSVRDVDVAPIAEALEKIYPATDGSSLSLFAMLDLPSEGSTSPAYSSTASTPPAPTSAPRAQDPQPEAPKPTQKAIQASLLAQTMLTYPGPLSELLFNALTAVPIPAVLRMARVPHLAPVLTTSLTVSHAPVIFRRKLITRLYGHCASLSQDVSGSRVIDAAWKGTLQGLAFARERIAEELAEEEAALRASKCGRAVWRNWHMDLYKRRRGEWVRRVREEAGNEGFLSFPDGTDSSASPRSGETLAYASRPRAKLDSPQARRSGSSAQAQAQGRTKQKSKTPLELARERFAAKAANGS